MITMKNGNQNKAKIEAIVFCGAGGELFHICHSPASFPSLEASFGALGKSLALGVVGKRKEFVCLSSGTRGRDIGDSIGDGLVTSEDAGKLLAAGIFSNPVSVTNPRSRWKLSRDSETGPSKVTGSVS
nr:hypothetical protein Itr_chr10CG05320 [Ipomoea trifida]